MWIRATISGQWRSRWFIVAILSMAKEPCALAPIAWQSAREIVTATFTAKRVWCVGIVTVLIFRSHLDALETLRQHIPTTVIIPQRKSRTTRGNGRMSTVAIITMREKAHCKNVKVNVITTITAQLVCSAFIEIVMRSPDVTEGLMALVIGQAVQGLITVMIHH